MAERVCGLKHYKLTYTTPNPALADSAFNIVSTYWMNMLRYGGGPVRQIVLGLRDRLSHHWQAVRLIPVMHSGRALPGLMALA